MNWKILWNMFFLGGGMFILQKEIYMVTKTNAIVG